MPETKARTYGNWRQPKSSGILGLGVVGTVGLFFGIVIAIINVMVFGLLRGLIVGGVILAGIAVITRRDRHGKNAVSRVGARLGWWTSRTRKAHLYRSGPLGRTSWGTYQLPGIAAPTKLSEHSDSYGRRFALLFTPATSSYSVVIGTSPDGSGLVDQVQIDSWVAEWGNFLSGLADEPGIKGASVTIETAPDSGTRLRREVKLNMVDDAPPFARAVLEETVSSYPVGASTLKAFVTLTFSSANRAGGRRRDVDEMARELGSRLPGLTAGLERTGAGAANPLTAQELCETIRIAYDPDAAVLIDEAHALGETPDLRWPDVGPAAAQASWDGYRHDSAFSYSWAMSGAPRGTVQSSVLTRLLAPHRDIDRKRVTLLYRPIDPAVAVGIVEADLRAAMFRASSKQIASARDTTEIAAARATAQEEAAGAGLVNFAMLVTATVTDVKRSADARAAIDNISATARIRLRPVYGSQDSAFAAALPLGFVLREHIQIPAEIRENL